MTPSPAPDYYIVFTSLGGLGDPIGCRMPCKAQGTPRKIFTCADMGLETSSDKQWEDLFQLSTTKRAALSLLVFQDGISIQQQQMSLPKFYGTALVPQMDMSIYFSETAAFRVSFTRIMPDNLKIPPSMNAARPLFRRLQVHLDPIQIRTVLNVQMKYIDPHMQSAMNRILENELIESRASRNGGTEMFSTEVAEYTSYLQCAQLVVNNPQLRMADIFEHRIRPHWVVPSRIISPAPDNVDTADALRELNDLDFDI